MTGKRLKSILELSADEKTEFRNSFDTVICDCDGVLWELTGPILGSGDGVNSLLAAGKKLYFVTNNSNNSDEVYLNKFKNIGFNLNLNHIIHPIRSIIGYLEKIKFSGLIYCIASKIVEKTLIEAGYKIICGPHHETKSFSEFLDNVLDNEPVRAVVYDYDLNISNAKLVRAQLYLRNPDCLLIVGGTDKIIPLKHDVSILGPGSYVDILTQASGRTPIVLGKPGRELGNIILDKYGIRDPKRVIFIGDALELDIGFGKECGFQTLCILTGISSKTDMEKYYEEHGVPSYYANGIRDFVEFFKNI